MSSGGRPVAGGASAWPGDMVMSSGGRPEAGRASACLVTCHQVADQRMVKRLHGVHQLTIDPPWNQRLVKRL